MSPSKEPRSSSAKLARDGDVTLTMGDENENNKLPLCIMSVVIGVLCGIGIGVGIGYAIWSTSVISKPVGSDHPWLANPCFTDRPSQCPDSVDRPPLILVSLDGFRYDYLHRGLTPNLDRLGQCGVRTPYMFPVFPSSTFPNHYSIATGLLPVHHGIIDNNMYDPVLDQYFSMATDDSVWWGGEPIWNTVMKNNLIAGCYHWVGSSIEIQGMRPNYYFNYSDDTTPETKINTIQEWLQYPNEKRPDFITLYFNQPDKEGHNYGPDSPEVDRMIATMDNYIGDLMDAITEVNMENCTNIIVLADHGMANRSCDYSITLENHINVSDYNSITSGAMLRYRPKTNAVISDPEAIVDHLKCQLGTAAIPYVKTDTPKRWHYMDNVRIEDTLIPVDQGYTITDEETDYCDGGSHGYDNVRADQMRAIFVAYGPTFKGNIDVEPFLNVELMNLMCDVLGIEPPPNDGEAGNLHHLLHAPPILPPRNDISVSAPLTCLYPASEQDYADRINDDVSECTCESLQEETTKQISDFDEQLDLTDVDESLSKAKHAPFGMPQVNYKTDYCELVQTDYVTAYSHDVAMPLYVTYTIDKGASRDTAPLLADCSRPDVRVPSAKTPNCSDYDVTDGSSNITKGFLYSPGLTTSLDDEMDALISSNIVPQYSGFIKDIWGGFLDVHLPLWADEYNGINVVTGPIFDYDYDGFRDSIDVLKAKGIALSSGTFIPTHFFVVINRCTNGQAMASALCAQLEPLTFIVRNVDGIQTCQTTPVFMETHVAAVKDVELLSGLRFYPDIDRYQSIHLRTYNTPIYRLYSDWIL